MKTITLTIGISNSGKTTWTEEYVKQHPETVNINRDDLRACNFTKTGNLSEYKFSKAKENEINNIQQSVASKAKQLGFDIIISDTNLNPKTRKMWCSWAVEHDYLYIEKVFDIEPHKAKDRNIKRDYSIPPHVIDIQYRQFREYMGTKKYNHRPHLAGRKLGMIFDMDGTLADMVGIRKPYEWKKCINDRPRWTIINMLNMYSENYDIIIMSGRDSVCREETEKWLKVHGVKYDYLFMRKEDDNRSDPIIKEELFLEFIYPHMDIHAVVDDRQRMVDHWRNMGLECWQVQDGNF